MKISGPFTVNMAPLDAYAKASPGAKLGRMSIDKTFTGDLAGSSQGEMLTAMTDTAGSAGYVAIEKFVGTLNGKAGSFALQHFGIMHGEISRLVLEVVPASGTGELVGISGTMEIRREEGGHFYDFEFEVS
jgi:hypothetical protein